jgi:glycine cleavage system H protein
VGNTGYVGISDYAQEQLSDIVYVEILVAPGETVKQGDSGATIESVKAAAEVYMPVSGEIIQVNEDLPSKPELVNSDPYGEAWMIKIDLSDPTEVEQLLDAIAYQSLIDSKS